MSTIHVTGGTGFIGRAVVDSLRAAGHFVRILGRRPPSGDRAAFRSVDLLDSTSMVAAMRDERPDTLIHLAWDVTHGDYWNSPLNETWAASSVRLAQTFADSGGRRIVFAGTCAEEANSLRGTVYARAKAEVRQSIFDVDGIDAVWLRIFFPVGPQEDRNRLVPSLVRSLAERKRFLVRQPSLVRDFCSVGDVGSAFAAAAVGSETGTYEVGSGTGLELGCVAGAVATMLGTPDLVDLGPVGEPDPLIASTERLTENFGWHAMVSPHDALTEAVEWWKDHL